jgi:hypothetical protein
MTFSKTEIEKADLLGDRLVIGALATCSSIMEQLNKDYDIRLRDKEVAPQFIIEVAVFYMHLLDRLAFAHLGPERREVFTDRLIVAIVKVILAELSKETSADDFCIALRDTYNHRQIEYSRYKKLIPEKDESPKDTLYWEFSKILLSYLNDQNPVAMLPLVASVADFTNLFLTKSPKVEDVLRS